MSRELTRGAILIALSCALQFSLRQIALPGAMLLVGIIMNAVLILTVLYSNRVAVFLNALAAPLIAVALNAVPSPLFILPVLGANLAYVYAYQYWSKRYGTANVKGYILTYGIPTVARILFFLGVGFITFYLFGLLKGPALFVLYSRAGVQIITGFAGGLLADLVYRKLSR